MSLSISRRTPNLSVAKQNGTSHRHGSRLRWENDESYRAEPHILLLEAARQLLFLFLYVYRMVFELGAVRHFIDPVDRVVSHDGSMGDERRDPPSVVLLRSEDPHDQPVHRKGDEAAPIRALSARVLVGTSSLKVTHPIIGM